MFIKVWHIVIVLISLSLIDPPERLEWQEESPLRWEDFKGTPDYLLAYAANTNSGMSHAYSIDGNGVLVKSTSTVLSHFYTTFSWYKPADTTTTLLRHEQSHFDITELYARKLRKRIHEFQFTVNSKEELKKLYDITEQERKVTQKLYDKETDHSRIKEQELVWARRIKDSIEKYWMFTP